MVDDQQKAEVLMEKFEIESTRDLPEHDRVWKWCAPS
jgi:hypothetical protein